MDDNWEHIKTIMDGEEFEIHGLNIWDHPWIKTGERVIVKDPHYHQNYSFYVFKIEHLTFRIQFAAGEFSNCVYGIYEEATAKS